MKIREIASVFVICCVVWGVVAGMFIQQSKTDSIKKDYDGDGVIKICDKNDSDASVTY